MAGLVQFIFPWPDIEFCVGFPVNCYLDLGPRGKHAILQPGSAFFLVLKKITHES